SWRRPRVSELRVLPDQLSGLTQCCDGFFFVCSRIKRDGNNLNLNFGQIMQTPNRANLLHGGVA
ncbi:MAG: hypothetical protein WAM77_18230, partial [Xanthobacteraceae bacterium]